MITSRRYVAVPGAAAALALAFAAPQYAARAQAPSPSTAAKPAAGTKPAQKPQAKPAAAKPSKSGKDAAAPPPKPPLVVIDRFEGKAGAVLEPRWATVAVDGKLPWYVDEPRSELRVHPHAEDVAETISMRRPFSTAQGLAVSVDVRQLIADWENPTPGSGVGIALLAPGAPAPAFSASVLHDAAGKPVLEVPPAAAVPLPAKFRADVPHQLLLVYKPQAKQIDVLVDGGKVHTASAVTLPPQVQVSLLSRKASAAFNTVAVAEQDRPASPPGAPPTPVGDGWHVMPGDVLEQRMLGAIPQLYPAVTDATDAESGTASVVVRGWAFGRSVASPRYGLRVQMGEGAGNYVDALIDPAKRVLTTRGVINGREVLAPQDSPLPPRFEYTDEHRVRIAWSEGGAKWTFSVDNEAETTQERGLLNFRPPTVAVAAAGSGATPGKTLFVPILITEDTRAAYYGLSVTGVAASAQQQAAP